MKSISIKLDEEVFIKTEEMAAMLNLSRGGYIIEAIVFYNRLNKRKLLEKQLRVESALTSETTTNEEFTAFLDVDLS